MKVDIPKKYLDSTEVDNSFFFKYTDKIYENRIDVIRGVVKKKNKAPVCVDVGAVGYLPQIEEALKRDEWIHKVLKDISKELVGVDINEDGIKYCKGLGYDDILLADIETDAEKIMENLSSGHIDYIVFGEMLHEVDDPIGMLRNVRNGFKGKADRILITVPSMYSIHTILYALEGTDRNHSENRFWYSPYSLCRMVSSAGFIPRDIYLCGKIKGKKLKAINFFYRKNLLTDHIVMVADF